MQNLMQKSEQENIFQIFIILIIICIFQYGIEKIYGFTLYPDEFGYWASAANAAGYDWSEVASMGSYYSFGYSLILTPILKLFLSGVAAYRAAIAVNMLLMCISIFLLRRMAIELFPELNGAKRVFICGAAALYPSWIFYMQMTMAEALLCFLFVLVSYLFLYFIRKPGMVTTVSLAVALVYIYCVHMRTVGVVVACVITCLLWGCTAGKNKKQIFILIMILIIAGLAASILKKATIFEIYTYAEQDTLATNDYGSQFDKLEEIFTVQGSIRLLEGIVGKIFYLGNASFGLIYWAIGWCTWVSISLGKKLLKKEEASLSHWFGLFLLLASMGEILISSIYMLRAGSIDGLIYGRYNELIVPMMILVGITAMERSRFILPATLLAGVVSGGTLLFLLDVIEKRKLSGLRGYHMAGMSYLLEENNLKELLFFRDTWILGFSIMILVSILIWLSRRWNNEWMLTGILIIEIIAGLQISHHYTYRVNHILYENQAIADMIREHSDSRDGIFYLDEGNGEFVDFLQMQLRERPIHVLTEEAIEEELKSGSPPVSFLITDGDSKKDKILQQLFDQKIETNMFCLYFNEK